MASVPDVTAQAPLRRMSVARGRLENARPATADHVAAAKAAASIAAKDSTRLIPTAVPFQLTDATCVLEQEGAAWTCTMTVQGYGRVPLSAAAMAGVCAALLALVDATGSPAAVLRDVAVVQDVVA